MAVLIDTRLAAEICDALGLKNVTRLILTFSVNAIATAEATFYPEENGVKRTVPILKHYELRERAIENNHETV